MADHEHHGRVCYLNGCDRGQTVDLEAAARLEAAGWLVLITPDPDDG